MSNEIFYIKPGSPEDEKNSDEFIQFLADLSANNTDNDGLSVTVTFGPMDAAPFSWRVRRQPGVGKAEVTIEVTDTDRSNVVAKTDIQAHNTVRPNPVWAAGIISIILGDTWLEKLAELQADYAQSLFVGTYFDADKFLAETDGKLAADQQAGFLFTEIVIGEMVAKMRDDKDMIREVPGMLEFLLEVLRVAMLAQEEIWKDDSL